MEILNKNQFLQKKDFFINEFKTGKIFIFPTDTVYGLGCIASKKDSILRVREIKRRDNKPFSIIVPSIEYIFDNFELNQKTLEYIDKLPGKYTFILNLKKGKTDFVLNEINPVVSTSVGIRIPNLWFKDFVKDLNKPIIATSVNFSGENPYSSIEEIDELILNKVDYIIDDGELSGRPSKVIDLTQSSAKIVRE